MRTRLQHRSAVSNLRFSLIAVSDSNSNFRRNDSSLISTPATISCVAV